jgi:serine-type D-Ala-D-Ala carboxypeptidase (penicillin-binding protein 5/6)
VNSSSYLTQSELQSRRRAAAHRRRRIRRRSATAALSLLALVVVLMLHGGGSAHSTRQVAGAPQSAHAALAVKATAVARSPSGLPLGPPPLHLHFPAGPDPVQVRFALPPRSGLLVDLDNGAVLWQRDPAARLPIASLTKMMTALIVVQGAGAHDAVRITPQALHYTGSGMGVLPRNKLVDLTTLLYGLMLPSGNDAAIALAQHMSRTLPNFVAAMNAKAAQLGLGCTRYSSPSGIVDQGNYSCATDLAELTAADLAEPLLARVVRTRNIALPLPIKGGKVFLYNNNPLVFGRYPGVIGMKTGFTDAAGPCLVVAAQRGGVRLAVVLLHSPSTALQAEKLLDAGFAAEARARPGAVVG